MEDINRVTLIGRLTAEPELKGQSGQVLPLRLAFTTRSRSAEGEWADRANYVDCVVFGKQAEVIHGLVQKGTRVCVDGRLDWQEWESQGAKRSKVQIIASSVQVIDGKRESTPLAGEDFTMDEPWGTGPSAPVQPAPVQPVPESDDIPF